MLSHFDELYMVVLTKLRWQCKIGGGKENCHTTCVGSCSLVIFLSYLCLFVFWLCSWHIDRQAPPWDFSHLLAFRSTTCLPRNQNTHWENEQKPCNVVFSIKSCNPGKCLWERKEHEWCSLKLCGVQNPLTASWRTGKKETLMEGVNHILPNDLFHSLLLGSVTIELTKF